MTTVGTKRIGATAASAAAVLLAVLLTSCGGDGSLDLPSPSGSVTASLPSPTRTPSRSQSEAPSESPSRSTSPTESASEPESESPTRSVSPTRSEGPEETSAPPSESPSESSSSSEPTEPATSSSPPAEEENPADSEEDEGLPSWFWWVLAGLVLLGGTLAAILIPRARRRGAWDADLAAGEDEVAWFARELVPALQQAVSPDAVAGGWQVAAARVTQAEDRLTGLESTAPDEVRRSRAHAVRDAVRAARLGIENVTVTRDAAAVPRDLAAIASQLEAVLTPTDPAR